MTPAIPNGIWRRRTDNRPPSNASKSVLHPTPTPYAKSNGPTPTRHATPTPTSTSDAQHATSDIHTKRRSVKFLRTSAVVEDCTTVTIQLTAIGGLRPGQPVPTIATSDVNRPASAAINVTRWGKLVLYAGGELFRRPFGVLITKDSYVSPIGLTGDREPSCNLQTNAEVRRTELKRRFGNWCRESVFGVGVDVGGGRRSWVSAWAVGLGVVVGVGDAQTCWRSRRRMLSASPPDAFGIAGSIETSWENRSPLVRGPDWPSRPLLRALSNCRAAAKQGKQSNASDLGHCPRPQSVDFGSSGVVIVPFDR